MRRSLIAVFAVVLVSGCGADGSFDADGFEDLMEVLEEMEDASADPDGPSDPDDPLANTASPHRPPRPDGGIAEESSYNEEDGYSSEVHSYSPLDAAYEDVIDFYEDYFGWEGHKITSNETGTEFTAWENADTAVSVEDRGTSTGLYLNYYD